MKDEMDETTAACRFCQIVWGRLPAHGVYGDSDCGVPGKNVQRIQLMPN